MDLGLIFPTEYGVLENDPGDAMGVGDVRLKVPRVMLT